MADNRIISNSEYIVFSVYRTATDNKIIKRPYDNSKNSSNRKQQTAETFNNTMKAAISPTAPPNNKSSAVSSAAETTANELENMSRLKSEENARLVQARFNNNNLDSYGANENYTTNTDPHNTLDQSMEVDVDLSDIYKKIELLNTIKNK